MKLTIGQRLLLGFSSVIALAALMSIISIFNFRDSTENSKQNIESVEQYNLVSELGLRVTTLNMFYMDAIIDKDGGTIDQDILDFHRDYDAYLNDLEAETKKRFHPAQQESFKALFIILRDHAKVGDDLFNSIRNKEPDSAFSKYDDVLDGSSDKAIKQITTILREIKARLELTTAAMISSNETSEKILIVLFFVVVLLGVAISYVITKRAIDLLTSVSFEINESKEGNLRCSVKVGASASKVAESVTQQAAAVQETVSTLNQISAIVSNSVENISAAVSRAEVSATITKEGLKTVESMKTTMDEIQSSINHLEDSTSKNNQGLEAIAKIIDEIFDKTTIINDIVFQTKLLSFNASVESARAGELGKGFAVVAEEVGVLAKSSGTAAREIGELVQRSKEEVTQIIKTLKDSSEEIVRENTEAVKKGVIIVEKNGEILHEIHDHVERVKENMFDISRSSKEQETGIRNITEAMNEIDSTTNQSAKIADDTRVYAEELRSQASVLARAVTNLNQFISRSKNAEVDDVKTSRKNHYDDQSDNSMDFDSAA